MRNSLFCLLAAVFISAAAAGEPFENLNIADNGKIAVGTGSAGFSVVNSGWSEFGNTRWREVKKESGKDFQRFTGRFEFEGVPCTAVETVRQLAPNKFRIECDWQFERDVKVNGIFSGISMPLPLEGILVDGKNLPIPELPKEMVLRPYSPARTVAVRQTDGFQYVLSGDLDVYIQDSRKWVNALTIRLAAKPGQGTMRKSHAAFDLELLPVETAPVDLAPAARDFFDLNVLPVGTHRIGGVPFVVRDDRKAIVGCGQSAARLTQRRSRGRLHRCRLQRRQSAVNPGEGKGRLRRLDSGGLLSQRRNRLRSGISGEARRAVRLFLPAAPPQSGLPDLPCRITGNRVDNRRSDAQQPAASFYARTRGSVDHKRWARLEKA